MGKTPSTAAGAAFAGAFPRVRVINLAQRADRRREMEAEFAKLGLALATASACTSRPAATTRGLSDHRHARLLPQPSRRAGSGTGR